MLRAGAGEAEVLMGSVQQRRRDSVCRPSVALPLCTAGPHCAQARLRSAVSIVLGVTSERIPVIVFWADTCKWPGSSCEFLISFCLARLRRSPNLTNSARGELRLVLWPWNRIRGVWLLLVCHI